METPDKTRYLRIAVLAVFALIGALMAKTIVFWLLDGWLAPNVVRGWSLIATVVGACAAAVAYACCVSGGDADERDGNK